ncbi:MAG: SMC-Scp complex subunit ScpB, partial [Alteromonas sp.]|nr:SMC-Scp complex subunit ScpB [Alteromonas sp.]
MTSFSDLPNADAFENMAESVASDSPLKVLNAAPSE